MRITIGCLMLGIAVIACLFGAAVYFGDGVAFTIVYGLAALTIPVGLYAIWIGLIVGLIHLKRFEIEQDRRRAQSE